jgi:hypothetical protein
VQRRFAHDNVTNNSSTYGQGEILMSRMHAARFSVWAVLSLLTPLTPSSRAQLGGGLPVHITNIRRLPDGRITFYVGYEYY